MCSLVGSWISSWFWVQRFYWFSQLKRESWSFDQVGISCLSNSQWISLLSIIHLQILLRALRLDARRDSLLKATATFLNNRLRLGVKEIGREKIVLKTSHHQNYEREINARRMIFEVWISYKLLTFFACIYGVLGSKKPRNILLYLGRYAYQVVFEKSPSCGRIMNFIQV